jgi:hypothetical protein
LEAGLIASVCANFGLLDSIEDNNNNYRRRICANAKRFQVQITMIGSGYRLVSGACFADLGYKVICVDADASKIDRLKRGEIPIFEPSLDELFAYNVRQNRLSFITDLETAVKGAEALATVLGRVSFRKRLIRYCFPPLQDLKIEVALRVGMLALAPFQGAVVLPEAPHRYKRSKGKGRDLGDAQRMVGPAIMRLTRTQGAMC